MPVNQGKQLILKFLRKVRTSNKPYRGRGRFNTTMPGVYHNKNWKYSYTGTYNNRKGHENVNMVLFFNTKNGSPFFIHPISGARKQIKNDERYFRGVDPNAFLRHLKKRTRYNYWPVFSKKATRYLRK